MSTYVISDIHGCYNSFLLLLKKINFNENDKLYILGDVIDRGPYSYEIYSWIKERYNKNVYMILGNHEDMFMENIKIINKYKKYFNNLNSKDKTEYFLSFFEENILYGYDNYGTIKQILNNHTADNILEMNNFFKKLPLYLEIFVNDKKWTLVHSSCEYDIKQTIKNKFIWDRDLIEENKFINGKNIIFGHTPTICSKYSESGNIEKRTLIFKNEFSSKINIDCGCVFQHKNSKLGILRLDDLKEFYVKYNE